MNNGNIISMHTIKEVFSTLIKGQKTREDISNWASNLMQKEDNDELIYDPKDQEELIWSCISYLSGVDIKESPDQYLHVEEDFKKFFHSKFPE